MAAAIVRARAVRWVSDEFPGSIEVQLVDGYGREHLIVDKVPALTNRDITPTSAIPAELWLQVDAGSITDDLVAVTFASAVATTDGRTDVEMRSADVRWL